MPKETCLINESLGTVESRNIHVGKDFVLRDWCTYSKNKNQNYFSIINPHLSASIMSNETKTNSNNSFSSDNNLDNDITHQSHIENEDQSAIRLHSETIIQKHF